MFGIEREVGFGVQAVGGRVVGVAVEEEEACFVEGLENARVE